MMCVSPFDLADTLKTFSEKKIEYLHVDIMDGVFVPNYTLGPDYCKALRSRSDIPLDIHLMVEKPEDKIGYFELKKDDIVSVHVETTDHLQRLICKIKESGAKAYAALNPATPLCMIEDVLCDLDGVLIMTVNPGFAGQKMVPQTIDKIIRLSKMIKEGGYEIDIEVDGNVSFENAKLMKAAGANVFVVGTASIFGKDVVLTDGIDRLRNVLKG